MNKNSTKYKPFLVIKYHEINDLMVGGLARRITN